MMQKRIDTADVVLGMFIHKLEGNWFSHPFWREKFLLTDPRQLERLHASAVPAVIIDTELGIDPDVKAGKDQVRPATSPVTAFRPPTKSPLDRLRPALPAPPPSRAVVSQPKVMSAPPAEVARGFGKANALADRGLIAVANVFLEARFGKQIEPTKITPVINSIISSMQSNPTVFSGLMQFRRDSEYYYRHALATSALMIALGRNLRLQQMDLHAAGLAGLLLDAGVNMLPVDQKELNGDPRRLPTNIWQSHVQLGQDFIVRSKLADPIARACVEHHERYDGTGWPNRVRGTGLSLLGRMAAICDAYDFLATAQDGQPAINPVDALRLSV